MIRIYCTYFDKHYITVGLALILSLRARDPECVVYVVCLDYETEAALNRLGYDQVHTIRLSEILAGDLELREAQQNRSKASFIFTLSPNIPLTLLRKNPDWKRVTYLDADIFFFSDPSPWFKEWADADVAFTAHRFPPHLRYYERHGKYNKGMLGFRNTAAGISCLEWWRERCLEWCEDYVDNDRYADQGYLNEWPTRFSARTVSHPGINLAPWNWSNHQIEDTCGTVRADRSPLVCFHFARFRRVGYRLFNSGQLDYDVMPPKLREFIYTPYLHALQRAEAGLRQINSPTYHHPRRIRIERRWWIRIPLAIAFGSLWLRAFHRWWGLGLGLGRWAGRFQHELRRLFRRK